MEGFGVHTSMWTMHWDRAGAERTIPAAAEYGLDFIEVALLNTAIVDAAHTRALLKKHDMRVVCSLGLPDTKLPSRNPDLAIDHLKDALDKAADMGAEALSGVTYGGIGEKTGVSPTAEEYDNVARTLEAAAKYAKNLDIALGIEPVNRYENHLINTGWQAKWMIEKVGADNIFIHLDTYHMNIEEKGVANGILDRAITCAISIYLNQTAAPPGKAPAIGMKFMVPLPLLASKGAWPWKASSICHLRLPMVWQFGDLLPIILKKSWIRACPS